jgi:selenocysteine lyase/cysteine desulfurase
VLAVSFVQYNSGFRADLRALAQVVHEHGGLLFCDAIQGLGALRLDVRETGVDFLAAGTHKWLLGPQGLGCSAAVKRGYRLAVRCNQHLAHVPIPTIGGAQTVGRPKRRFEEGCIISVCRPERITQLSRRSESNASRRACTI